MDAYEIVTLLIDIAALRIDISGLAVAIVDVAVAIFGVTATILSIILSQRKSRKSTNEGIRRERVRATLTEFNQLREDHENFKSELKKDWRNRGRVIRRYLADLERFALGVNMNAYDLEVVNNMSGSLLMRLHRDYFREFVYEAPFRVDSRI